MDSDDCILLIIQNGTEQPETEWNDIKMEIGEETEDTEEILVLHKNNLSQHIENKITIQIKVEHESCDSLGDLEDSKSETIISRTTYNDLSKQEKKVVNTFSKALNDLNDVKYGYERLSAVPYDNDTGCYKCLRCNYVDLDKSKVVTHYRRNHQPRNKMCLACCSFFNRKDYLLRHEYNCKAENADLLRLARRIVTENRRQISGLERKALKICCNICHVWVSQQNMKRHQLIHSQKKFDCTKCSAKFTTQESLEAHVNAHSGLRPYQCDECPKAYTSAMVLRAHKRDHKGQVYTCDECSRSFCRKYTLEQHLKIHTEEREFLCNDCGKTFKYRTALEAHARKHQGLPPLYPCMACEKRFNRMDGLNMHMIKFHNATIITRKMFFSHLPRMKSLGLDAESLSSKDKDCGAKISSFLQHKSKPEY